MYFVYVLQSDDGRIYKGLISDLDRRLREHKQKYTRSTRGFVNPKIVYSEQFLSRQEARKREVYLKSAAGRRYLKKILV